MLRDAHQQENGRSGDVRFTPESGHFATRPCAPVKSY